ncbi:MAG: magnesium chelatase subunit D [Pseudomonadota bacterium]
MDEQEARWLDAELAAACVMLDGHALGGVRLRARPGPVRDFWLQQTRALAPAERPWRKIPLHCSESRLLGGLDLSATLRSGSPVMARGLLADADGGIGLLCMAERATATLTAPLAALLDDPVLRIEREGVTAQHPCSIAIIALDEGVDDEALTPALAERLALHIDLDALGVAVLEDFRLTRRDLEAARVRLADVEIDDDALASICRATLALGIDSPRAAILATRTACALAALAGATRVGGEQLEQVLRLVLLPRATRLPAPPEEELPQEEEQASAEESPQDPPPPAPEQDGPAPEPEGDEQSRQRSKDELDDERLLDAAKAVLPTDLLKQLVAGRMKSRRQRSAGKSGAQQRHLLRGRPMGSLAGDPRSGARLDLMATLRTAAPWQRLRGPSPGGARLRVEPDDFRVVRFRQRTQTVTVFVVDASGSAALYRLAEAKGAVELLLADCYVRRDEVALIAFRGDHAELLLPPTRSLVRAKRSLSALPGGGGTPLAAAIDTTSELLEQLERRGVSPAYVMLTDGRANICRDGSAGREAATEEALTAAQQLRLRTTAPGMVIDTSPRPHRSADRLARALDARYLPLPNADAAQLQAAVRQVAA